MLSTAHQTTPRFGWLRDPAAEERWQPYNAVLMEDALAASVPSLGSLVPGWLLTIPKRPAINLRTLPRLEAASVFSQAKACAATLKSFGGTVYHFEHGAPATDSSIGCGVDQAHLHTVPLGFDLISLVVERTENSIDWRWWPNKADALSTIAEGTAYYLLYSASNEKVLCGRPQRHESQLIRKIIAEKIGTPEDWDYKSVPCLENIEITKREFAL